MKIRKIKTMEIKTVLPFISNHRLCGSCVLWLLLFCSVTSFGQLKVRSLQRSKEVQASKKNEGARTKSEVPLSLPFFDDFSQPLINEQGNMFPDLGRWDSSYSVWVNTGIAINSPTINAATFDGLDSAGLAYNPNEIFLDGFTDSLVSRKIDLGSASSTSNPDPVLESERNSVYISFFYQWRGNGEAPDDNDDDYLELLFKNDLGKWESVLILTPDETFERDLFYTAIIPVTGDKFFHHAFQFQFRSFGRQSGPFDTWNLDYIYLNKGRNAADLSFPDRAAASTISPLFTPYSAMPYTHFLYHANMDSVEFDVQNLKNTIAATNYKAEVEYRSFKDGSELPAFSKILEEAKNVAPGLGIGPNERIRVKMDTLPDKNNPAEFNPEADSVDVTMKIIVISGDETDDKEPFLPYDLRINDTITTTYNLRNFYAYDDGSAEYAVELIETGNFLAYEFNLPPGLPDTLALLEAIDIYFPPYGLPSDQNVDFYVFAKNIARGVPGARLLTIPSYRISRPGVNQFQRIRFLPALGLDTVNTFYIGWKQPISGDVLVGLDNSNDTGSKVYVNVEGNNFPDERNAIWEQNNIFQGSLMIRPVFGTGVSDPTTGIEDEVKFSLYPNPSHGNFYIEGPVDKLDILSITGQRIPFHHESDHDKTLVQLNASPGLYILRYSTKAGAIQTHKIIIKQ